MILDTLTTIQDVHHPGTSHLTRYFRVSGRLSLKTDAIGVTVREGNAVTVVPWANVLDLTGQMPTEAKK